MTDEQISGFLLIDKPREWTSFDIVAKLRRITGIRKIGHAGTLDPLATGLLIVAIGRGATKQIQHLMKKDKTYITTGRLGAVSDSYDADGQVFESRGEMPSYIAEQNWALSKELITAEQLEAAVQNFRGNIQQEPPMFSAKKVGGKKLYELARQGKVIERKKNDVTIYEAAVTRFEYPEFDMKIACSTGTYIRSIVHDIGQSLGAGAYITILRRTHIDRFSVEDAWGIDQITPENWQQKLIQIEV